MAKCLYPVILRGLVVSTKQCCKTCKHWGDAVSQASQDAWCRMRKINVHGDIAQYVFCHHWTKRAPSLPILDEMRLDESPIDRQLELGNEFVEAVTKDLCIQE